MLAQIRTMALQPRTLAAAIVLAGFSTMLAVNLPGHLEFDSIRQLLEGRRGVYANWHPPIMSWLLGVADAITPGAAAFVVFDATLAFGSIFSLLWLTRRPSWLALAAAAVAVALPQLFLFQAIVWKDILFADACVAGFVCLAHAAVRWQQLRWRFALLAASATLIALAVLTRQNGVLILPCGAIALGMIAVRRHSWRMALFYSGGFLLAAGTLALGVNAALQLRATKALGAAEQVEDLQIYDMAGMLRREPSLALPILAREAPAMAHVLQTRSVRLYTPATIDHLIEDPAIGPLIVASRAAASRQWSALVLAHPGLYLSTRAEVFSWVFLSAHPDQCPIYTVGVDGDAADLRAAGLKPRYDDRDTWLDDNYGAPLSRTLALSHPFFVVMGLLCLVLLLRRGRPPDFAIAGLLCAIALYAASYYLISIACEYRYLYAIDLAAIVSAFYLAMDMAWPDVKRAMDPQTTVENYPSSQS
jgi:hypothetical protein